MRRGVAPDDTTPVEHKRPKDGLQQGFGALLLLAGSALFFSEPRMDESLSGGGLGLLLFLLGSGLMIVRQP